MRGTGSGLGWPQGPLYPQVPGEGAKRLPIRGTESPASQEGAGRSAVRLQRVWWRRDAMWLWGQDGINTSPTPTVDRRRETDALKDTPSLWFYVCFQGPGPFVLPRAPRCCV